MKQSLFNSEVWNMIFAAEYLGDNLADVIEIITCGLYDQHAPSLVEQSQGMEKSYPALILHITVHFLDISLKREVCSENETCISAHR